MMSNPEAYNKSKSACPGNLPQGHATNISPPGMPTAKETARYQYDISKSQARGYETKEEAYRIRVYELQYAK